MFIKNLKLYYKIITNECSNNWNRYFSYHSSKNILEYNCKVYIIDSENVYDKKQFKENKTSFLPKNINKSPKFNNKYFTDHLKNIKKI